MIRTNTSNVTIVDYRAGNLASVVKAVTALGATPEVTSDPEVVAKASKIILPGVGHFAATQFLSDRGLTAAMRSRIADGVPFLGICVGLQWLFEGSTEAPGVSGGGFLRGHCERFVTAEKVPHVGWNSLSVRPQSRLMAGVADGSYVYFTHSYRAGQQEDAVAVTNYGGPFTAAVEAGNIMGVQFHPEKSGKAGLTILKNFLEL
ncbi:Imidazole glycerol phosphate synthase amidotransferase subunit [Acidisarcina polymorpha]|uniref:Imidazole glycerol phosphate synthase subunit HisH n=1 Tax=Acidisarcina polymorpha TaxID=2211140 RepID=A0A2Z5G8S6_9BACT|nr:imidazole glycerol phosphate synthase subunit HisH [Acidisarcina polymorpha]AXC15370.1 Imidazole glycerol phosphate synthase amidotransferase subunit [Acidisarcina polymorpha]